MKTLETELKTLDAKRKEVGVEVVEKVEGGVEKARSSFSGWFGGK